MTMTYEECKEKLEDANKRFFAVRDEVIKLQQLLELLRPSAPIAEIEEKEQAVIAAQENTASIMTKPEVVIEKS